MCDACSEIPCIQMCCPHGEAFFQDPNPENPEDPENEFRKICIKNEGIYEPTFHDHTGEPITSWNRNDHYLLVAPKKGKFICPVELMSNEAHYHGTFSPIGLLADPDDFKIFMDGNLNGTVYGDPNKTVKINDAQFKPHEFCVEKTEVLSGEFLNLSSIEFHLHLCKEFVNLSFGPNRWILIYSLRTGHIYYRQNTHLKILDMLHF